MKEKKVLSFDENEKKMVELLRSLGVPRKMANILVFLSSGEPATSREIEIGSELRQPEVSLGFRMCAKWLDIDEAQGPTGRPHKTYKLNTPFTKILEQLEAAKKKEAQEAVAKFEELKDMR